METQVMAPDVAAVPPRPGPEAVFQLATGFMSANLLFIANEICLFEKLAEGPATLNELATRTGIPRRTLRIAADAMVALGLIEREGERYENGPAANYLTGGSSIDMRPFLRFWNRLSYPRWMTLEDAVRKGEGVLGHVELHPGRTESFFRRRGRVQFRSGRGAGQHLRLPATSPRARPRRGYRVVSENPAAALSGPRMHAV